MKTIYLLLMFLPLVALAQIDEAALQAAIAAEWGIKSTQRVDVLQVTFEKTFGHDWSRSDKTEKPPDQFIFRYSIRTESLIEGRSDSAKATIATRLAEWNSRARELEFQIDLDRKGWRDFKDLMVRAKEWRSKSAENNLVPGVEKDLGTVGEYKLIFRTPKSVFYQAESYGLGVKTQKLHEIDPNEIILAVDGMDASDAKYRKSYQELKRVEAANEERKRKDIENVDSILKP